MPKLFVSPFEENFPGCDIAGEEFAFVKAIERYQREHRRRYPTWREVLSVLKSLGYAKVAAAADADLERLFPVPVAEPARSRDDTADAPE